jgi:hypothetical protein
MILEFWILTPLLLASGYLLGRWHNRRSDKKVGAGRTAP